VGARDKRDDVVWTCLIVSAILGSAMGASRAFWIILVVMIVGSAGGIRTQPGARPPGARRGGGGGRHHTRGR
jgi:hypothetical protein